MTEVEPKPNALQSLWGSGDVERDRKRRNTVKSMASPDTRPQTIYTPQCILDVVAQVWVEGINLDPCPGPDSIVKARGSYTEAQDGLKQPWYDRTYVNPPYAQLKAWLAKAQEESRKNHRIIMLCPVRTHRKWFRDVMGSPNVNIVYLDPLRFLGYEQAFPAPLCLIFWNATWCGEDLKYICCKVSK